MKEDLKELAKLSDSLSFLYVEKCIIEKDANSLVIIREKDRVPIPISSLTVLMLGPGTTITHAAITIISINGCMVQWCGENNVRFYALGLGETRSSKNLLLQTKYHQDPFLHMQVVKNMYAYRFPNLEFAGMDLKKMRGIEGVRVREMYKTLAKIHNVKWYGRDYDLSDMAMGSSINQALSVANSCLYGLCHSAICSLGFSPALGFIHTGRVLSFVYDIADLYKMNTVVPIAFRVVGRDKSVDLNRDVRIACREEFKSKRILKNVAKDIYSLFDIKHLKEENLNPETLLWDGVDSELKGGKNFAEE